MQFYSLLLALFLFYLMSQARLTVSTLSVTTTTTGKQYKIEKKIDARIFPLGTAMSARNRNTIIRRCDVEVSSYCAERGSISVQLNCQYLQIKTSSNFAAGCGQQYVRSLLTLDEIDLLPPNAVVKSAQMKLFGAIPEEFEVFSLTDEPDVTNEVAIKRIITEWNPDTVTWVTQPNTTDANVAMIPTTKATFPGIAVNTELYNFTIDITQLVRDIQTSGAGNNHGIMFQMVYEQRYRSMVFCSFNHPDIRRHPRITIDI
jgi:hypothetical protein